jgi:XTP/dITP diphosphohydrolase
VADSEEAVKQNWEKLKLKEGNKSVLSGVPTSLPALVKAMRIQEKARGVGFDWDEKQQVWGEGGGGTGRNLSKISTLKPAR